jgi:integrase
MPKIVNPLTDTRIRNAKPGKVLSDGGGLMLFVNERGARTWVLRYSKDGKRRDMTLGRHPELSLLAAREKRDEQRAILRDGGDPQTVRKEVQREENMPTFGDCADQYIAKHGRKWRSDIHRAQWKRSLEVHAATIRSTPVNMIDKDAVLSVVEPIWNRAQETGDRLRNRIELVLEFARASGHVPEDRPNPARWRGWMEHLLPAHEQGEDKHFTAMPYKEVPSFLGRLRASDGLAAPALEFVVLTGVRVNEALEATRAEFDLVNKAWTIPAARMKANRVHVVPLSDRAVEIVQAEMERHVDDLVFRGHRKGRPMSSQALLIILRDVAGSSVTTHGFKSSFRDWCGDCTDFPREVAESALAHVVGGVEGSYRRGSALDKRRALMDAWARHCAGGEPADNVVPMVPKVA